MAQLKELIVNDRDVLEEIDALNSKIDTNTLVGRDFQSNKDLNTIIAPGVYAFGANTGNSNLPPDMTYGVLEVITPRTNSNEFVIQRFSNSKACKQRIHANNIWYDWYTISE